MCGVPSFQYTLPLWASICKVRISQFETCKVRTCEVKTCQVKIGQVRTGQVRTGQNVTGQVRVCQVKGVSRQVRPGKDA